MHLAPTTAPRAARLIVVAAVMACHRPADARDRTLVVALAADPTHLFPPTLSETPGFTVADQMLERLAEPDSTLDIGNTARFRPRLADSWTWSADSLSIAFHIDPRARWHDGHTVTAHDVQFTFSLYTDPAVGAPAAPLLADIDSVTVRGDRVAVFWFHRRHARQLFQATYQMRVIPEHLLRGADRRALQASSFARAPVGSGPFRFRRWVHGQSIELAADAAYHREAARFDRLLFEVTPDATAGLARARAGEIDVLTYLRADDIATARAASLCVRRWPSLSTGTIVLNVRDPHDRARPHPVLGNAAIRRALTMAIDRRAIVASVFGAAATPAAGPLPSALLRDAAPVMLPFDPTRARDVVAAREHAGASPLSFALLVPTGAAAAHRVAVIVQEQLRRVGVRAELELADATTLAARLEQGDFDAALVSLDFDPDPLTARQLWGASSVRSAFGGYRSTRVASLFDSAARNPSRPRFDSLWTALVADAPAIWLYDLTNVAVTAPGIRLTGVRADAWWIDLAGWRRTGRPCSDT